MNNLIALILGIILSITSLASAGAPSDEDYLLLGIVPVLAGAINAKPEIKPDKIRIDYLGMFSVLGCSGTLGVARLSLGVMTREKIVRGVKVTFSYRIFDGTSTILSRSGLIAVTDKRGRANFPEIEFDHSATTATFTAIATDPVTANIVSLENSSKTLSLDFTTGKC